MPAAAPVTVRRGRLRSAARRRAAIGWRRRSAAAAAPGPRLRGNGPLPPAVAPRCQRRLRAQRPPTAGLLRLRAPGARRPSRRVNGAGRSREGATAAGWEGPHGNGNSPDRRGSEGRQVLPVQTVQGPLGHFPVTRNTSVLQAPAQASWVLTTHHQLGSALAFISPWLGQPLQHSAPPLLSQAAFRTFFSSVSHYYNLICLSSRANIHRIPASMKQLC